MPYRPYMDCRPDGKSPVDFPFYNMSSMAPWHVLMKLLPAGTLRNIKFSPWIALNCPPVLESIQSFAIP